MVEPQYTVGENGHCQQPLEKTVFTCQRKKKPFGKAKPSIPVTRKKLKLNGFYEDLQDLLEVTPKKDVLFIIVDWNAKVGSQETPGVTGKSGLGVQNEVGQRLIEFCQENTLVITNTLFQQHKRRLYAWTSPDGQH